MPNNEIGFNIDTRSMIAAVDLGNKSLRSLEDTAIGFNKEGQKAINGVSDALQQLAKMLLQVNDKQRNSMESLVRSTEKWAAAYGKTGVEKLIAQRDALIKRLGAEEEAIKRVTAAYAKAIAVEKERESGGHSSGGGSLRTAFLGAKDLAEGRGTFAAVEFGKSISGLEGTAAAAGIAAGAFAGLTLAGFAAAKSLADFGIQMNDVQLRTGLTADELGKFDYAAKAAGTDISIVERTMRGLTVAVEEGGTKGDAARKWLERFGVNLADVRSGNIDAAETLRKVGEGLAALPSGFERNKAAIDIFKKAGIELIPTLVDLSENFKTAEANGLGFEQSQITGAKEMQRQLALMDRQWDDFLRKVKQPLALGIMGAFELVKAVVDDTTKSLSFLLALVGRAPHVNPKDAEMQETEGYGFGATESRRGQRSNQRGLSRQGSEVDAILQRWGRSKEGIEKALAEAKANESEAIDKLKNFDRTKLGNGNPGADLRTAQASIQQLSAQLKAVEKAEALQNSLPELAKRARGFDTSPGQKFGEEFGALRSGNADQQAAYAVGFQNQLEKIAKELEEKRAKTVDGLVRDSIEQGERIERANESILESITKAQKLDTIDATRALGGLSSLVGGPPGPSSKDYNARVQEEMNGRLRAARESNANPQTIAQMEFDIRKQAADYDLKEALERVKANKDGIAAEYDARYEYETKIQSARRDFENDLGAIRHKQFEEVSKAAEGLAHTLFTNPKSFSGQLQTTLRDLALKPVEKFIGDAVGHAIVRDGSDESRALFVHVVGAGSSRTSGGVGSLVFGGGGTGSGGGNSGGGRTISIGGRSIGLGGGNIYSDSGGSSPFSIGGGSGLDRLPFGFPGGSENPASIIGPGGTPGFASGGIGLGNGDYMGSIGPANNGPGAVSSTLKGMLGSLWKNLGGGGSGSKGGIGDLGSWKRQQGTGTPGGPDGSPGTNDQPGTPDGGGKITGVGGIAGQALGAGGIALAEHGLLGNNRGTGKGILEGAGGGAMIGLEYGGPVGAAIGAAVGAGIGLGEMLAGVVSPRVEAKQLVKKAYGVNIPDNVADQIVSIAQSKYGNRVSVAVRSPEVRQMLGLYAASSGQSFPAAATSPHAGSLSEQNGQLFQNETFGYGKAYAFQSSLPVSGGYSNPTTLPGFGGNTQISLNIGPNDAASFMTGQFVTPSFVQSQFAASQQASNGRLQNSAVVQDPGLIIS